MVSIRSSASSSPQSVAVVLFVAAAFLLVHPYTGIRHDGTLYAGDALARLFPDGFKDDLYFLFGSQGRFTLLPALYAGLIAIFGLGNGTMVGLLTAFVLYFAATWYLVAALVPRSMQAFCVLSIGLGWTLYGGNRIFGYSEPFLTARSFAEPAVLLGLAWLLRGRLILAGLALVVALVIHPLIAAGGWLVAWLLLVGRDRRWAWGGVAAVVALLAFGFAARGPFVDLFARYDPQWLALVQEANGHAFVSRWALVDYGIVAFNIVVLWFAARLSPVPVVRHFIVAVLIAGIGATAGSLLLVDLLGNPFFGKLQIWRVEWVMQWVAMAVLPIVLTALWRREGEHGKVAAAFLAIGWIAPFSLAPAPLAAFAVAIELARFRFVITKTTTRIVCAFVGIIAITVAVQYEARVVKLGILLDQPFRPIVAQALTMNVLLLVSVLLAIRVTPWLGRAAPVVALVVLLGSLSLWDQRGPWTHKLESYATGTHIWPGLIEPTAKVYWYRDLIAPWVLLGHGNYYTQQQGSGAVFSRDMVVELDKRRKVTAILDFQEQICRMMNNLSEKQGSCEPDAEAVKAVCVDGGIDYVVLQSSLDGAKELAEFSTGVVENGYEKKFFLYRCSSLKP